MVHWTYINLFYICCLCARHHLVVLCQPVEGRLLVYLSVSLLYYNSWASVPGASINSWH